MSYRQLDHTADLAIELRADDLAGLFAEAVPAMTDCLTEVGSVRPLDSRSFRLRAPAADLLLVDWLGELLAALEIDGLVFARARTRLAERDGELDLEATVEGEPWDPERHPVKVQIKAVTYHGLEVSRHAAGWRARVIFDI